MQTTDCLALVKPTYLRWNISEQLQNDATMLIFRDFFDLTEGLNDSKINHLIYESPQHCVASVFPNNWVSCHWETDEPCIVVYPMWRFIRRGERNSKLLIDLLAKSFETSRPLKIIDLTQWEERKHYLEGTGSLVLDRKNKIAYMNLSGWSHQEVVDDWKNKLGYEVCTFNAIDTNGHPVYHTNVMMSIGDHFCVICLDAIKDNSEKQKVLDSITKKSHREVLLISCEQMKQFCGNILEVKDKNGLSILCLSLTAYKSFTSDQLLQLKHWCPGGFCVADYSLMEETRGSVRCSLLELFPSSSPLSLCSI
jgi:hypothetical protein